MDQGRDGLPALFSLRFEPVSREHRVHAFLHRHPTRSGLAVPISNLGCIAGGICVGHRALLSSAGLMGNRMKTVPAATGWSGSTDGTAIPDDTARRLGTSAPATVSRPRAARANTWFWPAGRCEAARQCQRKWRSPADCDASNQGTVRTRRRHMLELVAAMPDGASRDRFLPALQTDGELPTRVVGFRQRSARPSTFLAGPELAKQGGRAAGTGREVPSNPGGPRR